MTARTASVRWRHTPASSGCLFLNIMSFKIIFFFSEQWLQDRIWIWKLQNVIGHVLVESVASLGDDKKRPWVTCTTLYVLKVSVTSGTWEEVMGLHHNQHLFCLDWLPHSLFPHDCPTLHWAVDLGPAWFPACVFATGLSIHCCPTLRIGLFALPSFALCVSMAVCFWGLFLCDSLQDLEEAAVQETQICWL